MNPPPHPDAIKILDAVKAGREGRKQTWAPMLRLMDGHNHFDASWGTFANAGDAMAWADGFVTGYWLNRKAKK
jgi:hypothetical protein